MKRLRSFLAGFLLVPVLAFGSPLTGDADRDALNPTKPVAGMCWVWIGRWVMMPC